MFSKPVKILSNSNQFLPASLYAMNAGEASATLSKYRCARSIFSCAPSSMASLR